MLVSLVMAQDAAAVEPLAGLPPFLLMAGLLALALLIWDSFEVGRNDAANLVNAVFGSRVLSAKAAVRVAAIGVVAGATFSSPVMETTRQGIFEPGQLTIEHALGVYISVYIVDTVLLYGFSAFGMPVSTTACLVFALLGAAFAVGGGEIIHWNQAGTVVAGIICSIFITGVAAFFIQRAVRGAVRERTSNLSVLLAHGSWIGGGLLAGLVYFMIVKGMKNVWFVAWFNREVVHAYGALLIVVALWGTFGAAIHLSLVVFGRRAARVLFPALAIIGTLAMAFAFGQNDLANAASPGLSVLNLLQHRDRTTAAATNVPIPLWALFACGSLMALGMMTPHAQRVTRAAVNAGSQAHVVRLWAPHWCLWLARLMLRFRGQEPVLAPPARQTPAGKTMHYDVLRACVILGVSASVIATASGLGLPVSTTYVSFAAIVATGMADRILHRGDADLKMARTIWVVFSWFSSALIAAAGAALVSRTIFHFGLSGMLLALAVNLALRKYLKRRADRQEERVRQAALERRHPERFAEVDFE